MLCIHPAMCECVWLMIVVVCVRMVGEEYGCGCVCVLVWVSGEVDCLTVCDPAKSGLARSRTVAYTDIEIRVTYKTNMSATAW